MQDKDKALKVYPVPHQELHPEDIYTDLTFPEGNPYTVIIMVSTIDGKATMSGKANLIGTKVDHLLMRRIRAAVDGVMCGAGTLRKESINLSVPEHMVKRRRELGLRGQPLSIIVTGSGNLPLERTFFHREDVLVLVSEATPEEKIREISACATVQRIAGGRYPDLREAMKVLSEELGIKRLAVEGGPTLNYSLLTAGLAHEVFLTLSPKIIGGEDTLTIVAGPELPGDKVQGLKLSSIYSYNSELYLRYMLL